MASDLTPQRRLDRAALDRVLARAAELQSSFGENADASGMLSEDQIIELGREAGLSPDHLRQAMAEERTRGAVREERGVAAAILGPARVQASRLIVGTPREILDAIDGWMLREECLQLKRRVAERIVWEPRRDLVGNLSRAFNFGGRGHPGPRLHFGGARFPPAASRGSASAGDGDRPQPHRGRSRCQPEPASAA